MVASRRSGASRAPCAGSGRTRGDRGRPKDRLGQSSGSFRSRNGRERRRPVLALWLSERGWRAPVEARPAVGQPMPLGLAPVPVRALTLVAIRDLFGEEVMALEGAPARAPWLFRRAAPRRPVPAKSPRPSALWPGAERRSPADHRLLPQEILAHPDWAAAAQLPERRRRRVVSTADAALGPGFARRSQSPAGLRRHGSRPPGSADRRPARRAVRGVPPESVAQRSRFRRALAEPRRHPAPPPALRPHQRRGPRNASMGSPAGSRLRSSG